MDDAMWLFCRFTSLLSLPPGVVLSTNWCVSGHESSPSLDSNPGQTQLGWDPLLMATPPVILG